MFAKFAAMLKNKDIRKRILYTLLVLFVFRFGAAITVPGVDTAELIRGMSDNSLFAMLNLLGGGGLEQFSIFALGVTPYITASIIIQLLSMDVIPALNELREGGASGRKKMDRYTRYLAVILSFVQAYFMVWGFSTQYESLIVDGASVSKILYIATIFTAGSMFLLWLGDRISLKGIGNGVSIIIFAGIVGRLPGQISSMWTTMIGTGTGGALFSGLLSFALYLFCYLLIIVFVVFMNLAERKIPIQYTSSTVQTRHKDMTYLPLKINSASVIPVIFANALMMAPIQIASFFPANDFINGMNYILGMQNGWSLCVYVVLIILITFFYTKMQIDPAKIAENLGKSGTYIPGIRPGNETKEYINKVLCRITVLGAIGLAFIAVLPHAIPLFTDLPSSMGIGGTGIIIVVGVALETVKQLEGQLTQKSYKRFFE